MRNLSIVFASLFTLAFAFSCKPVQKKAATDGKPVTLETRSIRQNKGSDCEKQPDSLRTDCAIVDITAPKINGTNALSKSVDAWVDRYLLHQINWAIASEDGNEPKTVEDGIKQFFTNHAENAGSISSGQYALTCTHEALFNDGKYLTLMLKGYAFTGGNRVLDDVAIASFDVKTGKQLTWDDLVKNQKALLRIAQAKVQETRADAFKEGFAFDKEEPFALPLNYGLTSDGILMHYTTGEIYQLGGTTAFTVNFDELGQNLKIEAPAAPIEEPSDVDLSELYEMVGDSVVIPAFEVEVWETAKAAADMKKRKETVIVSAMFSGFPIHEKDASEVGTLDFLAKDMELSGTNRIARFEGLKFHKSVLDKLKDKDITLLINVFSGRKSSEDNLLNCGIVDAKASTFKNRRFLVNCHLISESTESNTSQTLAFALPEKGTATTEKLPLLVDCSEKGEISLAGILVKDLDELKTMLRASLDNLKRLGFKTTPEIQTSGCLMGMQGAVRDVYEEVKNEKKGGKTTVEKGSEPTSTDKAKAVEKPATKPAPPTKTTSTKPEKTAYPSITLSEKGDMTLNGKKLGTFDDLRKQLQASLLTYDIIPDDVPIQTAGTTGMGTRAEMRTEIADAIKGAKWLRKKAAIAAVTATVGKTLGTEVQLEVANYQTSGNFAFLTARPKATDGKAIDYSKTPLKAEAASGKFSDKALALLQYSNGAWKVLDNKIGVNLAPVDDWTKRHKAPKTLFVATK